MIDCNEWKTEKRHECANVGKVKRLELWWQLYRTSLPVRDLENFRQMDFCWTECTWHLSQQVLQEGRSSVSSFAFQYPLFFLSSSNICFRLLPRVPVTSIFPPLTCFRRQFLRKMLPIKRVFFRFIVFSLFLSPLTLCNTSSFLHDQSNWSSPSFCNTKF